MQHDDRLIVALDLPTRTECEQLVEKLGDTVNFYKIGLGLLCDGGLDLAIDLKKQGKRVFLDMKLFDITATVQKAVCAFAKHGFDFLTVHGDPNVVIAAHMVNRDSPMKILAVTFLTSVDRLDLNFAMFKEGTMEDMVSQRAWLAIGAGADGLITSPHEASVIRALPEAKNKLIITPAVRPACTDANDQKRFATPAQAIQNGADHIVICRPIWLADDPREAVIGILTELPAPQPALST